MTDGIYGATVAAGRSVPRWVGPMRQPWRSASASGRACVGRHTPPTAARGKRRRDGGNFAQGSSQAHNSPVRTHTQTGYNQRKLSHCTAQRMDATLPQCSINGGANGQVSAERVLDVPNLGRGSIAKAGEQMPQGDVGARSGVRRRHRPQRSIARRAGHSNSSGGANHPPAEVRALHVALQGAAGVGHWSAVSIIRSPAGMPVTISSLRARFGEGRFWRSRQRRTWTRLTSTFSARTSSLISFSDIQF